MNADSSRPPVERANPPKGPFTVVNAVLSRLLASRFHRPLSSRLMLLKWSGWKTGRRYSTPVGFHVIDGVTYVLTRSAWWHNFQSPAPVTALMEGRWRSGTATAVTDPDLKARVYAEALRRAGGHTRAMRVGLKVNLDREPTHQELRDNLGRNAVLRLDLR